MECKVIKKLICGNCEESSKKKCGCQSLEDCSYNSESECKFDKTNCHLARSRKKKKKYDHTNLRICFFGCVGVLGYLISVLVMDSPDCTTLQKWIFTIVSGVSISIVAGAILAKVIDLPSKLEDYQRSFVEALASNSYLKSLDENRLTQLRNDITEQLHKANAPCMAKSLIEVDQRICELLRQPYYSRYRHSVICSPSDDKNYIMKEHSIDYRLINPYSVNRDAKEYISFTSLVLLNEDNPIEKTIWDLKISYTIDDEDKIEIKEDDYEFVKTIIENKDEFYNTKIVLDSKNKKSTEQMKGIRVDFKDNLQVRIQYKIKVHIDDICYTKRLRHPVKNFRLDYSYSNMTGKLYGQIFGTEMKQSDVSIRYPSKDSITLETFDWLLPDNGAIVVMLKNEKSESK